MRLLFFIVIVSTMVQCTKHYTEPLRHTYDPFTKRNSATMVREYRSEEGMRGTSNLLFRYRLNVQWQRIKDKKSELHGQLTLYEYQEILPDLVDTLYMDLDGTVLKIPFLAYESSRESVGVEDGIRDRKVHFAQITLTEPTIQKVHSAQRIRFRLYAGQATYTFNLPSNEMNLLHKISAPIGSEEMR